MVTFHRLLLLICVTSIFAMGLVMIFNTTSAEVLDHALAKSTHQALFKQMSYAFIGLILAAGVWSIGYQRVLSWSPYLLIFFSFLLLLTLIPGIGKEVNGSRRWLGIAGFSFQPSEFVKYIVPAYLTYRLQQADGPFLSFKAFLKLIAQVGIPILLILVEPNNGTAGVIGLSVVVMCVMTRVRFKYWALPLSVLLFIGAVSAYHLPYVSARLKVYLHPELDLRGKGHQPYQAKIAAGSGQIFGRGPGNSLQKLSYLPEAQNDYIAAIYAEEFGFIGIASLVFLYMLIGYVGFYIAHTTQNRGGFYFATAITFLICFQAFMNLGVVSGLLPSTGLNLPFFSQGGTSLMANIMGLGLLLNIAQEGEYAYV
ncbi:putative lipid II flippase FtsW [Candidatus Protochlamydia phocaeensis]|uniref:putative lipid II flippase FtsW n=1 Tax=Candidatus Protochlamydia phocaeensis TaxID=1414722 RepID=UPI00083845E1|nr:putative lipid II flippase FtsW [Candidatus Protochlamydia phocaeensis]